MLNRSQSYAIKVKSLILFLFFMYLTFARSLFLWILHIVPDIEANMKRGKTIGYIYIGAELTGSFNLLDGCRYGVAQALKELKSLGMKTAMLTGDNRDAAMSTQEQVKQSHYLIIPLSLFCESYNQKII